MSEQFTTSDLEAYLDEALAPDQMSAIESALRNDGELTRKLVAILGKRDAGVHSLGEVWRRHRITCPSREQLGSYLLNVLDDEQTDYIEFHLGTIACRYCQANLEDLREQQGEAPEAATSRRKKYFQSSAGYLRRD